MEITRKDQKDLEKHAWEQMVVGSKNSGIGSRIRKLMAFTQLKLLKSIITMARDTQPQIFTSMPTQKIL